MAKPKKDRTILLVEDNEKILAGNKRMLEWEGYTVETAVTLSEAAKRLEGGSMDIVILDIMLPDGSGLDFLKGLREDKRFSDMPVLLLTGLGGQEDILRGLQNGGDDYLTKPYDFPILLARIEALLRRAQRVPERISAGRLALDVNAVVAQLDGEDLLLTQKEFALLLFFVQHRERYIDGEYLYQKIWNQPAGNDTNALRSTIRRLRQKLKGSGWQIDWQRGEGYCFLEER